MQEISALLLFSYTQILPNVSFPNKLSHLAEAAYSQALTQEAPLSKTPTTEKLLKCLVENTEDIPGLKIEMPLLNADYFQAAAH